MPTLNLYVSKDIAARLSEKANAKKLSLSNYITEVVIKDLNKDSWPEGFLTQVVGSWQGEVEEPEDLPLQEREPFDMPS